MVRVHDVAYLVRTVRVADAIVRRGPAPVPADGAVSLRDIEASGHHGVTDAERAQAQPFAVDVSAEASLASLGAGDDLAATVDYAELQQLVLADIGGDSLALIESLARRIADTILRRWPQVAVADVRVRKVNPPLPAPGRPEARVRVSRETLLA
jgi:dihydroneopterin aldolase